MCVFVSVGLSVTPLHAKIVIATNRFLAVTTSFWKADFCEITAFKVMMRTSNYAANWLGIKGGVT